MKKLILDIKNAIAEFGAENIDFAHYVYLYRKVYTKDEKDPVIVVGPWHSYPNLCIEVEMLLTQTPEGPQFDEDTAREWLESLNLNLPPDDDALHHAADKARELGEPGSLKDFDEKTVIDIDAHVEEFRKSPLGRKVTQVVGASTAPPGGTRKRTEEEKKAYIAAISSSLEPRKETPKHTEEDDERPENEWRDESYKMQLSDAVLEDEAEKIRLIIYGVKKGPDMWGRRLTALNLAGYFGRDLRTIKNFGVSGTVKIEDGKILAQLSCNTGYRNCKVWEIYKLNN